MSKKKFTNAKYEAIKKLLTDNKVSSSDLDKYIQMKGMRYARYREESVLTDEEMLDVINDETTAESENV